MEPFYEYLRRANHSVKSHQEAGVKWCLNAERNGHLVDGTLVRGGFIADEMGLGKTNQMIGTCLCNPKWRTLIVLPRALLEQWATVIQETLRHEPIIFHGYHKRDVTLNDLHHAPFVLTTYGMLAEPKKEGHTNLLHEVVWERVIFDEAHHLRNKNTAVYRGTKKLNAEIRWLVTGTPIQNKKSDFFHLCAVLGISTKDPLLAEQIMLRRTKAEAGVVLPALREHSNPVRWQDTQEAKLARRYHENVEGDPNQIVRLLRARQTCVMPALVDSAIGSTSKLDRVVAQLQANAANGRAKLVFCHFRGEIDAIQARLKGQRVASFDGRVKPSERKAILSEPVDVLLCQIQTGCEGLNLQQFDEVYFVSPHWNPAVEDQAVARCHRIGQRNTVDVYRFYMDELGEETASMDAHVRNVQDAKRELADELMVEKLLPV